MLKLTDLKKELRSYSNKEKAKLLQGFFKTGPGEYAEGDIFLGVMVPQSRIVAKKYKELQFSDIRKLLYSKIHEERLIALFILIHNFQTKDNSQKQIFDFYLRSTKYINNWDLVDLSAHKIVGAYLFKNKKGSPLLKKLAKSKSIWERRIAVISTFYYINNNEFSESLEIARMLLKDDHDLIHKAVGWMLREIGKRSLETEEQFLKKHYKSMPRTMLRYSIERFPKKKRKAYLFGKL